MTTNTLAKLAADKDLIKQATCANVSFEAWAIDTRQGYDLSREDRALMATYRDIKTEHAWRGYCYAALTAQALPAAEPVAWTVAGEVTNWARDFSKYRTQHYVRPVYTAPQATQQAAQSTTGAATTGGGVTAGAPSEPFGYFKAQPFGWTDCAETDDGAVALYERPQQAAQAPAGWREQHDRDSAKLRNLCRARDVARQQRDHARACYDSAVKLLTGIHALLYPAPITVPDGRTMVFRPKDPDPHAVLQELSDRIRALPDALAALSQPPQPQSAQEDAA